MWRGAWTITKETAQDFAADDVTQVYARHYGSGIEPDEHATKK
jgi:hypothetical protein